MCDQCSKLQHRTTAELINRALESREFALDLLMRLSVLIESKCQNLDNADREYQTDSAKRLFGSGEANNVGAKISGLNYR